MSTFKLIGKNVLILFGGALLGILLLVLAFCVPVNQTNQQASYRILEVEGWYPMYPILEKSLATYFHSLYPGVLDGHTDSIMVYTATDTNAGNPFVRAMNMYNEYTKYNYSYYWHGYVSVLRPLLALFDYGEIRVLNSMVQIALFCILAKEIWKKKGIRYAVLCFTSYMLLMPVAVSLSMQFSWVFYVAIIGTIILLKKHCYFEKESRYLTFFMIMGMVTCYMDLLTYPLFTWGLPVIWYVLFTEQGENHFAKLKQVVLSGIWWIVGYGGIWILKWMWGTIITGEDIFEAAWNEVFLRSGTLEDGAYSLVQRLDAISLNWKHYEYKIYLIILLLWLGWILYASFRQGWKIQKDSSALFLIGLSSVVWYFVMANHTAGHHFFAYRNFNVSVTAILALMLQSTEDLQDIRTQYIEIRSKKIILCGWIVCFGIAGLLTLTAREQIWVHNGNVESIQVELPQDVALQTVFVPTFSEIEKVGLAVATESTNGSYELLLMQNDEVLYRESIEMAAFEDGTYHDIPVEWKLKKGQEYLLELYARDTNQPVFAIVSAQGMMSMNELKALSLGGNPIEGQPIMGITYNTLPVSKKTLLFLYATWVAITMATAITTCSFWVTKRRVSKQSVA